MMILRTQDERAAMQSPVRSPAPRDAFCIDTESPNDETSAENYCKDVAKRWQDDNGSKCGGL
jgi:hypothetical protein